MKLTNRLIVSARSDNPEPFDAEMLANVLRKIADKIEDGYTGGASNIMGTEILWDHETADCSGFRHGIIYPDTMQQLDNLLEDYDEDGEAVHEKYDLAIGYLDDAISLLNKIKDNYKA